MANIPYGVAWRLTLTAFPAGTQCVLFAFTACWPGLPSAHTRPLPWRILIWFAAAILVIAIGFSRIYLGIHSPSDIVAGYLAATVWVGTIILLDHVRKLRRGRSDRNPYPEDECRYFWVANTSGCVSPAFTSPKNFRRSAYSSWRKAISAIAKVRLMVTVFPWTLCFKL
jgi:hypothetical protein